MTSRLPRCRPTSRRAIAIAAASAAMLATMVVAPVHAQTPQPPAAAQPWPLPPAQAPAPAPVPTAAPAGSVTLYGAIDLNLGWGDGSVSSNRRVGYDGLTGSRIGVRGREDLGGGWSTVFVVEHGFVATTGVQTAPNVFWNRQVFVGAAGPFGEVTMGRQYTPNFLIHAFYDIFGPQGVAAQQVLFGSVEIAQPANLRADSSISWKTPAGLGGFSAQLMVSERDAPVSGYRGGKIGWTGSAFSAELAHGQYRNDAVGGVKAWTAGARWAQAPFKATLLLDRAETASGPDSKGASVGASYTFGVTEVKAAVGRSQMRNAAGAATATTTRVGLGFVHSLSKRTHLYGQVAHLKNSDGAKMTVNGAVTAPNHAGRGFDLGIAHLF